MSLPRDSRKLRGSSASSVPALLREKREIEDLLQQMDVRLAEIASYLASDTADQKSAQTSSQQFDLLVTGEVRSLGNDV